VWGPKRVKTIGRSVDSEREIKFVWPNYDRYLGKTLGKSPKITKYNNITCYGNITSTVITAGAAGLKTHMRLCKKKPTRHMGCAKAALERLRIQQHQDTLECVKVGQTSLKNVFDFKYLGSIFSAGWLSGCLGANPRQHKGTLSP